MAQVFCPVTGVPLNVGEIKAKSAKQLSTDDERAFLPPTPRTAPRAYTCAVILSLLILFLFAGRTARAAAWPASEGTLKAQGSPELPKQGRFLTRHVYGDHAGGLKIARMLQHELVKQGYVHDARQPDLVVTFGFDVFRPDLKGESRVLSAFQNLPRSAFVFDPAAPYGSPPDDRVFTDTRRIFTHTLVVRISRAQTGGTLWQGVVTESGWCSASPLYAPRMLNLMFSGFPETTASTRALADDGDAERELMAIFPQGLSWDCLTVWHGRLPPRSGI